MNTMLTWKVSDKFSSWICPLSGAKKKHSFYRNSWNLDGEKKFYPLHTEGYFRNQWGICVTLQFCCEPFNLEPGHGLRHSLGGHRGGHSLLGDYDKGFLKNVSIPNEQIMRQKTHKKKNRKEYI